VSRARDAVVINADDFGISAPVNLAIAESFARGWITSATLMANMPGFDEACAMIDERELHGRIGLHLVVTEGPALTTGIRRWPRLCTPDGALAGVPGRVFRLEPEEARDLEAELVAQIEKAHARGIMPTHFDSHGHFHTQWPVATVVMRLARRYRVPAIRLSRTCGPGIPLVKRGYKLAFNTGLHLAGFAATRHFGSAADVETLRRPSGAIEIMVHPGRGGTGDVVDLTPDARSLADVAERWSATHRLASYSEL
jgi:predicted glycoside hydrolase/deacetylase ChbG (UPF0249 family)